GTPIIEAYFCGRDALNPNYYAYYGKESDVLAHPINGFNLATKKAVMKFVPGGNLSIANSSQGSGYGRWKHPYDDLRCRGIAWGENVNGRENTFGHFFEGATDHEATLISELGL